MIYSFPISVVIPTFNEEATIIPCIESLLQGDYPVKHLEFLIADGRSTDRTRQILTNFQKRRPEVKIKVLDNPQKTQGYGLNIAIHHANSASRYIIRIDAHSTYPRDYIRDCLETAEKMGADNTGSMMLPIGRKPFQSAVAYCMMHPLGVGNSKYHLGRFVGYTDTAYLGCFKKEILEKLGGFDPLMTPNEDAELNLRIKRSGGTVYLNSNLRVEYYPRDSFKKLLIQYFHYGQGRCRTVKKHKQFTSIRQIIPPSWFLLSLLFLFLSFFSKFCLVPLLFYFLINLYVSIVASIQKRNPSLLFCSLCFTIMHYGWGFGFLTELFRARGSSLWSSKPQYI